MEIDRRACHQTGEEEERETKSPRMERASVKDCEEVDVDAILARCRSGGRRRRKLLYQAPEFVKRLNAFEDVKAGSTVTFECRWQALPRPAIKWYRDDEEITDNNRFTFQQGDNGDLKLIIDQCKKADEGAYKCKAENTEGVASTTGYLSVTGDVTQKVLSAQPRTNAQHAVSNPPRLRAIVEQKSLELREEEEYMALPPSPINDFIESFQRSQIWPQFCTLPHDSSKEADGYDSGSDTSVESQDYDRIPAERSEELVRQSTPDSDTTAEPEEQHDCNNISQRTDRLDGTSVRQSQQQLTPGKNCEKNITNKTATAGEGESSAGRFDVDNSRVPAVQRSVPDVETQQFPVKPNVLDNINFPWLFLSAISTIATLVGTSTGMPPSLYVIIIAIISLFSFRLVISEETRRV